VRKQHWGGQGTSGSKLSVLLIKLSVLLNKLNALSTKLSVLSTKYSFHLEVGGKTP